MSEGLIKEFELPEHLQNKTVQEIHKGMLGMLPDRYDKSEGQFAHDYTWPTAVENAELFQFTFPMQLMNAFPMWATGKMLDYCGKCRGMARKSATPAIGTLTVTAKAGTIIHAGDIFATASENGEASINFTADEETLFSEAGTQTIAITAVAAGISGNVAAESIVMKVTRNSGIQTLLNTEKTTGGTEEEDDESFRIRQVEYDQTQGEHFTGCPSDYKRWAESVDGTGTAKVIRATDDSGLVTIILLDGNNEPATEELCQAVYDYIMREDNELERKAPTNATLLVSPPEVVSIVISATVELEDDTALESVQKNFTKALHAYLHTADEEVVFTKVCALLSGVTGVVDYSGATMNGGTENITLANTQMAVAGESELTV